MLRSSVLVLAILAMLVCVGAATAGPITVREIWGGANGTSYFTLQNDSTNLFVAGFAVGNNEAYDIDTDRLGWDAAILGEGAWNDGYSFPLVGSGVLGDYENGFATYFDTSELEEGNFSDLFGEDFNQALLYHGDARLMGGPNFLVPGDSDSDFFFLSGQAESPYWIILSDGTILGPFDTEDAPVPEPGSLALLGLGLAGLGLAVHRRRRKASQA